MYTSFNNDNNKNRHFGRQQLASRRAGEQFENLLSIPSYGRVYAVFVCSCFTEQNSSTGSNKLVKYNK